MAKYTKLKKELSLFDVFAISTGAMFSSGFFLLPGIASGYSGPSVVVAYLIAGVLVVPAMLSKAELATAMPKAGGTYYFIDRSMGPLLGTIGGIGTWFSLMFKSAFALIGIGAYLAFFVEIAIKPLAIFLTIVFAVINIVGAKETGRVQGVLVIALLSIVALFVVQGLVEVFSLGIGNVHRDQFRPFAPFGWSGLMATVGMVFVSYGGLTKVASVAEEVKNPDRNIPLGMALSLAVVTLAYVVGVYIMVGLLDPIELRSDLTPVATASEAFFDWLPGSVGLLLVVVAAIAAFASTGNAGIMSASRYPLAMARDGLVTRRLARVGRFNTPDIAILVTAGVMIFFILILSEEGVVKLASAFKLLIFGMINLAVIVMRESQIPSYVPGYRSPLYPWVQILGILVSVVLIVTMGLMPLLFTAGIILGSGFWYYSYGRPRTEREGAIYHLFARLGRNRDDTLDYELRGILKERGPQYEATFQQVVTRAHVIEADEEAEYRDLVARVSQALSRHIGVSSERLEEGFLEGRRFGATPVSRGVALPHLQLPDIERPFLLCVRSRAGLEVPTGKEELAEGSDLPVHALFFLVSPKGDPGHHLQILAHLAQRIDESQFIAEWLAAENEQDLKEALLHHERYVSLTLKPERSTADLIGKPIRELDLPDGTLVALVSRHGQALVPGADTRLKVGDRVTVIGSSSGIRALYERYGDAQATE